MTSNIANRGAFITLEGVDGAGKSTQVKNVIAHLEDQGFTVCALREPGGTAISEKIRAILLDPANGEMADECELYLYEASRAQLVRQVIEPALARGEMVVCDRFYDSTYAYQAGGRGLDETLVRQANALGSCGLVPDLTIVLDMDPVVGLERAGRASGGLDRMEAEGLAFQQKVRAAYQALAQEEPGRMRLVDASGTLDEVKQQVLEALAASGVMGKQEAGV